MYVMVLSLYTVVSSTIWLQSLTLRTTNLHVRVPVSSVMYSVSSTHMATARYTRPWYVWRSIGQCATLWLRVRVTSVLWTATRQRRCVTPRHACRRSLTRLWPTSRRRLSTGVLTSTTHSRSLPCSQHVFHYCW